MGIVALAACQSEDKPQGDRYAPRERNIAGQSTSGAASSSGNPSLEDASTPTVKGGMTVQPPAEPVGPTPGGGGSGSAGTGSSNNGASGTGR